MQRSVSILLISPNGMTVRRILKLSLTLVINDKLMYLCLVVGLCRAEIVFGVSISSLHSSLLAITSLFNLSNLSFKYTHQTNLDFLVWGLHVRIVSQKVNIPIVTRTSP